jgi:phosphoglucosamine mutase
MAKQLFGTDGIRAVAGEYPLDRPTVFAFGTALADTLRHIDPNPEVLIGMDTRESGQWIAEHVAGGLARRGVRARFAGVITTPGVASLTRSDTFAAGVMISASHNPYQDNGLKVFSHSGYKLPDEQEHEMEQEIFTLLEQPAEPAPTPLRADPALAQRYIDSLLATTAAKFHNPQIVVDCGNGAASQLAPELFRRAGASVTAICCEPNGRNINLNCGALHVGSLREAVVANGARLGVAFDGDADRAIFVSSSGKTVDGDAVLLMAARALKSTGHLPGDMVVATVMSNLGLERALERHGIKLLRTPVGDKYVLEEMLRAGAVLGGEQSGHIIFREYSTTGDGLLTALRLIEIVDRAGIGLDELSSELEIYPQCLVNVRIRERKPMTDLPAVAREIRACEDAFGASGRTLVRFSGTEPLARVMVEGPDLPRVKEFCNRIASAIEHELGAV